VFWPGLNPIVNIWSHVELKRTGRHFSTKLFEAINIEWKTSSCFKQEEKQVYPQGLNIKRKQRGMLFMLKDTLSTVFVQILLIFLPVIGG